MSHKFNWSTALFLVSSPVMAASPYFPETPTIDTPADAATNVALNPELSGSALLEKGGSSGNLVFDSAEWRVSAPNDRFVITGGTRGDETINLDSIPESTYIYDIPSGFNFHGVYATRLEVTNTGIAELIAADDSVIATITMQPGELTDLRPKNEDPIIISAPEATTDLTLAVTIQWTYVSDVVAGDIVMQASFLVENGISIFTIPKNLDNPLFDISNSLATVDWPAQSYTSSTDSGDDTLPSWKDLLTGADSPASEFALNFKPDMEGNVVASPSSLNDAPGLYEGPEYIVATGSDVTLSDPGLALEPATDYAVQVRYSVLEGASERKSDWSEPSNFQTGLNTDYTLTTPATTDILASVPKTLEFEISNNGSDGGQALIEIRLPFNGFEVLEGRFSEHYNATSDAAIRNCDDTTDFDKNETYLHCEITLEAGATAKVTFLATFYDEGANTFDYRVCETLLDRCDDTNYEAAAFNVAAAPEVSTPEEEPVEIDEDSGSSSGGGSILWLTILGVALLRRPKTTSRIF